MSTKHNKQHHGRAARVKEEWEHNIILTNLDGHKRRRTSKKPRVDYGKACCICKRDHKACNGQRPCQRCTEAQIEDQCKDGPKRKFGRPKRDATKASQQEWEVMQTRSATTRCAPRQQPPQAVHYNPYNTNKNTSCCSTRQTTKIKEEHHLPLTATITNSTTALKIQEVDADIDYLSCFQGIGPLNTNATRMLTVVKTESQARACADASSFISCLDSSDDTRSEDPMHHYLSPKYVPNISAPLLEPKMEGRKRKRTDSKSKDDNSNSTDDTLPAYNNIDNTTTTHTTCAMQGCVCGTLPLPAIEAEEDVTRIKGLLGEVLGEIERMTHTACSPQQQQQQHYHPQLTLLQPAPSQHYYHPSLQPFPPQYLYGTPSTSTTTSGAPQHCHGFFQHEATSTTTTTSYACPDFIY